MPDLCRILLDEDPPLVELPVVPWQRWPPPTCSSRGAGPCPVLPVLRRKPDRPATPADLIRQGVELLLEPGNVAELRAPKAGRQRTISGYFDDPAALARAALALDDAVPAVYVTLNPVDPALLARAANRAKPYAESTTTDAQAVRRRYLLIDCDSKRPAGVSSTDAEHEAALERAYRVRQYLFERGWPAGAFILADSGNGAHLLVSIDLPNDAEALRLVTGVLKALATEFDDETVVVDSGVANAARITKLYGTMARKGDSMHDRPHRRSRVLEVPAQRAVVPRELLETLVSSATSAPVRTPDRTPARGAAGQPFDLDGFIGRAGLQVRRDDMVDGRDGGQARRLELEVCPFNPDHHGSAFIIRRASGALTAGCQHNSCTWGWSELRERIEPGYRDRGGNVAPFRAETVEPATTLEAAPEIPWPEPIGPEALIGPAGAFVRLVEPHTEAAPAALLLGYLLAAGSAIGPFPRYRVGGDDHAVRLFAVLVGDTSRGRKGSSWGWVRELVAKADPTWRDRVASGLSSGEGMVWAVRDSIHRWETPRKTKNEPDPEPELVMVDPGVDDKRLCVVEGEFASTLRVAERDGSTLSAMIRSAWDVGPAGVLQSLVKNSPGRATGAHISILGHVTAPELRRYLTSTEAGNGYGNRILWVAVRRSKLLPDGGSLHPDDLAEMARDLGDRVSRAKELVEVRRSPEAAAMWREVYPLLTREEPGLLGAVTARAEAQVLRLSLLYAVLEVSPEIRAEHLTAALEVWRYCEDSARYIFGDAVGDPVGDEILRALRGAPGGLTRNELRDLFSRNVASGRMGAALDLLARSGKATMTAERTGGRPAERWRAKPARGYAINAEDAERVPS